MSKSKNSFSTYASLKSTRGEFNYYSFSALEKAGFNVVSRLPFSLKILLENLLRKEDGVNVTKADIESLANWSPDKKSENEIAFMPARVILQDFTGVPCVVDLASMRDAVADMGGNADVINPLQQVDLVIDHSVQVDQFGKAGAFKANVDIEYQRNEERYSFLRWGQTSLNNFRVVPPGTGIVHQVNVEYLGQIVYIHDEGGEKTVYPDTLIGTDSHTTMINGLGILGWGVGGIEAEAAMLGQSVTMLIPEVVGFKLTGKLKEGITATDLVLVVTQMLRKKGVVGKFVEFYGTGLSSLSLPDRTTLANMAPEYGATMGFFPVDEETLNYFKTTGRSDEQIELVKNYCQEQGLFRTDETVDPIYNDTLTLDMSTVEPSISGPKRPQDRIDLKDAKAAFGTALPQLLKRSGGIHEINPDVLDDGSVVIAAITSCTNTSNPGVLIEAGLLAKKAVEKGLKVKDWVKTSLAPGSKVVIDYLQEAGLMESLEKLGFYLVGYGCTTCIGNSGPLPQNVEKTIQDKELVVASVLSGNRNFEGRIHPLVRANYLMSPPLVVAYAIAGSMTKDIYKGPLGIGSDGKPVYLKDLWPNREEVKKAIKDYVRVDLFQKEYGKVFEGDDLWKNIASPKGSRYEWKNDSTYIRRASFLEGLKAKPDPVEDIQGAKVLALLGDSVTTDHISPAGSIQKDSPAGKYLIENGVKREDFNSYGSRRGNHEVMVRGTFANSRLRNQLAPGTEGGFTRKLPGNEVTSIYEASQAYLKENTPLIVLAGKEYGTGSSRDWAAKGTKMLGIKAVIAESYERIHRSNLVMMGVLPLQFKEGENAQSLGLTGEETYSIGGFAAGLDAGQTLEVSAESGGKNKKFNVLCRIDTPKEIDYFKNGGILPYVIRQLI